MGDQHDDQNKALVTESGKDGQSFPPETLTIPAKKEMTLVDTMTLGEILAKSGMFNDVKTRAQAVVKMLAGRELDLGPIVSMTKIYIVKGKVTLSAEIMGGLIKRSGEYNFAVTKLTNEECKLTFYRRNSNNEWLEIGESTFTIEDANRAGVSHGENWKHYPRNMLFARALSNGARWFCPHLIAGAYTPEEIGASVNDLSGEVIPVQENGDGSKKPPPSKKLSGSDNSKNPTMRQVKLIIENVIGTGDLMSNFEIFRLAYRLMNRTLTKSQVSKYIDRWQKTEGPKRMNMKNDQGLEALDDYLNKLDRDKILKYPKIHEAFMKYTETAPPERPYNIYDSKELWNSYKEMCHAKSGATNE